VKHSIHIRHIGRVPVADLTVFCHNSLFPISAGEIIMNGALQPEVGKRRDEQRVKKLVIKTLFILAIAKKICVLMLWQSQNLGLKKLSIQMGVLENPEPAAP